MKPKMSMISSNSTGIKVALVEDDHNLQTMYKLKLELEGFTVAAAGNGAAGLQLAEELRPDIMLLDLYMPVMSGDEMLARMREFEWGGTIRVIVLTNISRSEVPPSLRFLNVDRYVVKAHSTPSQIVEIIREVLCLPQPAR